MLPPITPNCIYTHTNNQQVLKSGHLSNQLDTLVQWPQWRNVNNWDIVTVSVYT